MFVQNMKKIGITNIRRVVIKDNLLTICVYCLKHIDNYKKK